MTVYESYMDAEVVKRRGESNIRIRATVKLKDDPAENTITLEDVTGRTLKVKTSDLIDAIFGAYCQRTADAIRPMVIKTITALNGMDGKQDEKEV